MSTSTTKVPASKRIGDTRLHERRVKLGEVFSIGAVEVGYMKLYATCPHLQCAVCATQEPHETQKTRNEFLVTVSYADINNADITAPIYVSCYTCGFIFLQVPIAVIKGREYGWDNFIRQAQMASDLDAVFERLYSTNAYWR